jgi:hypothetical protein
MGVCHHQTRVYQLARELVTFEPAARQIVEAERKRGGVRRRAKFRRHFRVTTKALQVPPAEVQHRSRYRNLVANASSQLRQGGSSANIRSGSGGGNELVWS